MWVGEVSAPLSWLAGYGLWQTSVIPGRVCSHLLLSTDGLGGRANFWNKHKHGFRVTVPANVPGEICSSICWPKTSSSRTSWVLCLSWPFKTFFPLYVSKDNSVGLGIILTSWLTTGEKKWGSRKYCFWLVCSEHRCGGMRPGCRVALSVQAEPACPLYGGARAMLTDPEP